MSNKLITYRYSLYYFFNLGKYAFIIGYLPLYGSILGFSSIQIAILSSAGIIGGVISPIVSINLAHFKFSSKNITRIGSFINCALFISLLYIKDFYLFFIIWLAFMIIDIASASLIEAQVLKESNKKRLNFEVIRTWGSIGFIFVGIILGYIIDFLGVSSVMPAIFLNILLIAISIYYLSPLLPQKPQRQLFLSNFSGSQIVRKQKNMFIFVVAATSLIWASHGVIYVYLSLYLKALNWSAALISLAWNIGVVSEIILFLYFERIKTRFGLENILFLSALFTIIRLLILASTENIAIILLSQMLHAWTFGGVYLASQRMVTIILPEEFHDRSQGYLMSFGSSFGSLIGRIYAGFLAWNLADYILIKPMFLASAIPAFFALIITIILVNSSTYLTEKS